MLVHVWPTSRIVTDEAVQYSRGNRQVATHDVVLQGADEHGRCEIHPSTGEV
jgi:hypothetical protein